MTALEAYALSKSFTKHVALGIASMSVSGTTVAFVTTDGVTAKVTLPTPKDGLAIKGVGINSENHLVCTMSDDTKIDAGPVGTVLQEDLECNVSLGGITSGMTFPKGTPIETVLRKLLTVYMKPVVVISLVPAKAVYNIVTDSISSIVLKATVTKKSKEIVNVGFKVGTSTVKTITTDVKDGGIFDFTYNPTTPIKETTTFIATASDEDFTVTSEAKVTFVAPSYWGIVPESVTEPTEADVKGLANNNLKTTKALTYSDVLMTNSKICYAYPKSMGALTSIVSKEGYDYMSSYAQSTLKVDGIDYYCYTLKDAATIVTAGYKQIFA